jgi:hypothetical protein
MSYQGSMEPRIKLFWFDAGWDVLVLQPCSFWWPLKASRTVLSGRRPADRPVGVYVELYLLPT